MILDFNREAMYCLFLETCRNTLCPLSDWTCEIVSSAKIKRTVSNTLIILQNATACLFTDPTNVFLHQMADAKTYVQVHYIELKEV